MNGDASGGLLPVVLFTFDVQVCHAFPFLMLSTFHLKIIFSTVHKEKEQTPLQSLRPAQKD